MTVLDTREITCLSDVDERARSSGSISARTPHVVEPLSDLELRLLAFESLFHGRREAKIQAVRREFDLTLGRYAQILDVLLDDPRALRVDPTLIYRLRRLREARRARRRRLPAR